MIFADDFPRDVIRDDDRKKSKAAQNERERERERKWKWKGKKSGVGSINCWIFRFIEPIEVVNTVYGQPLFKRPI